MPKRIAAATFTALLAAAPLAPASAQADGGSLKVIDATTLDPAALRWQKRPLLVFADTRDDAQLAQQLRILREFAAPARERDIAVLVDDGYPPSGLRRRYGVRGFTVILVGKDGGVKLRQSSVLDVNTLLSTIDAMPMRQQEM